VYTYTNEYVPRFSLAGFLGPCRCLFPIPGLTSSTPSAVCVCACVYTNILRHTLPPASKIREDTDNTPISPSVKTPHAKRQVQFTHPRPPKLMNKLRIHERICTPCSKCVHKCIRWFQNTRVTYTPALHWCSKTPVFKHATFTFQNAHAPVHARLCNGAATMLPWKLLRHILRLVQTSNRLLFVACPPAAISRKSVARRCSLKKTIQMHASSWHGCSCIVAQASSDHPRWCGPHPSGLSFALMLGRGAHSRQKSISTIGLAGWSEMKEIVGSNVNVILMRQITVSHEWSSSASTARADARGRRFVYTYIYTYSDCKATAEEEIYIIQGWTNTHIPICLHTYIHTCTHTYISTYIHTKSYKPYKSFNPTLQTLPFPHLTYKPFPTTLQKLNQTKQTTHTCAIKIKN